MCAQSRPSAVAQRWRLTLHVAACMPACLPTPLLPQNPTQHKDIGTANAVGMAVLGSLCLMKGFDCC